MISKAKILLLLRSETVAILLSSFACCLMLIAPESVVTSVFGVASSVLLLQHPATFIPLVLTSAVSSSFSVFGLVASVFYYSFMMLMSLMLRCGFKFSVPREKFLIMMGVFFFWIALCTLHGGSGTLYLVIRLAIFLVLLLVCVYSGELCYNDAIGAILFSAPIICAVCILKFILAPVVYEIEGAYFVHYRMTIAANVNPNQLAPLVSFFAIVSIVSVFKRHDLLHLLSFVLAIVLLSLIKSRTGFYATTALSVIAFMILFKTKASNKLLALALAGLAVFMVSQSGKEKKTETLDDKALGVESVIEDGGSGRFFTWAEAFTSIIPANPVLGIGFGKASYEHRGYDFDADDLYVDLLCETGILGFLIFLAFFISLMRRVSIVQNDSILPMLSLVMLLVYGIGETLFDSEMFWTIIFISIVYIRSYGKHDAEIQG